MEHFDIIIVGGGMVGSSLSLALSPLNLRIALIEARKPCNNDPRLFALNSGSCQFLKNLQTWPLLASFAAPIHEVHVSYQRRFGTVRLLKEDLHLSELGYVIPAHHIESALHEKLTQELRVTKYLPATLQTLSQNEHACEVTVECAQQIKKITGTIVIAADGTDSSVRRLLKIKTNTFHYGQSALVTRTTLKRPHQQIAHERFNAQGAIAMLPLIANECATIWTADDVHIAHLASLSDSAFLATLQQEFGYRLGRLQQISKRHVFPIRMFTTEKCVEQRVMLLGNAAHTLSPLAAQGFNLALYEVAMLTQSITEHLNQQQNINMLDLNRLSEKMEKQQSFSIGASHRLTKLFLNDKRQSASRFLSSLVNITLPLGLIGLEISRPIKKKLLEHLMGRSGRIPPLLLENIS